MQHVLSLGWMIMVPPLPNLHLWIPSKVGNPSWPPLVTCTSFPPRGLPPARASVSVTKKKAWCFRLSISGRGAQRGCSGLPVPAPGSSFKFLFSLSRWRNVIRMQWVRLMFHMNNLEACTYICNIWHFIISNRLLGDIPHNCSQHTIPRLRIAGRAWVVCACACVCTCV